MRIMPTSPRPPVPFTQAGWPPRSSAQRWISSWSVVMCWEPVLPAPALLVRPVVRLRLLAALRLLLAVPELLELPAVLLDVAVVFDELFLDRPERLEPELLALAI